MPTNPCCCELQRGVRAIAILQIVMCAIAIFAYVILIALFDTYILHLESMIKVPFPPEARNVIFIFFIIRLLLSIILLIVNIVFLQGVNQKKVSKIRWWYVDLVLGIIFALTSFAEGPNWRAYSQTIVGILVLIYFTWCVQAFINQIRDGNMIPGYAQGFAPAVVPYGQPPPYPGQPQPPPYGYPPNYAQPPQGQPFDQKPPQTPSQQGQDQA